LIAHTTGKHLFCQALQFISNSILMLAHSPAVRKILKDRGEGIIEVDFSEFVQLDGGLTSLFLLF